MINNEKYSNNLNMPYISGHGSKTGSMPEKIEIAVIKSTHDGDIINYFLPFQIMDFSKIHTFPNRMHNISIRVASLLSFHFSFIFYLCIKRLTFTFSDCHQNEVVHILNKTQLKHQSISRFQETK